MIMMMKKQQWMFKQVFSMINYSLLSSSSSISLNNNNVLRRRPFCCSTTTPLINKKREFGELLEKRLPLLIVPYDHITPKEYVLCPPKEMYTTDCVDYYYVCDGTFGFINLFFHDDDQLIINKKKKKEVYDVYVPEINKRNICGSSEGWLATVHRNGEFQLLNPFTRVILHLPPFTTITSLGCYHLTHPSFVRKVVTNTITTTNSTTTTLPAAEDTVRVMAIYTTSESGKGCLAFCRMSDVSRYLHSDDTDDTTDDSDDSDVTDDTTDDSDDTDDTDCDDTDVTDDTTDETTAAAAAWIEIPVKVPMSDVSRYLHIDDTDDTERPECITYEVIDGVRHWVCKMSDWSDVTFYNGNFYTVGEFGAVGVVKGLDGPSPFVQFLIHEPPAENHQSSDINNTSHVRCDFRRYLVESSSSSSGGGGDLLMVVRKTMENSVSKQGEEEEEEEEMFERPYSTKGFRVFKLLNLNNGDPSWEEVTDLGEDCALFVGLNHSFAFSASKIPGCRGNCIYFTDHKKLFDYPNGGHDVGVYYLEDASFEKLNYETCSSQLIMPPPVWYVPFW